MGAVGVVDAVMSPGLCSPCSFWEARDKAEVAWPGVRGVRGVRGGEVVPAADRHCRAALALGGRRVVVVAR